MTPPTTSDSANPNPTGMAVGFAEDVLRANSWTLKGVGAYGSDVHVVANDHYLELAAQCANVQEACSKWAESATNAKERLSRALEIGERMCEALRYEANPACDEWDDLMADEFMKGLRDE